MGRERERLRWVSKWIRRGQANQVEQQQRQILSRMRRTSLGVVALQAGTHRPESTLVFTWVVRACAGAPGPAGARYLLPGFKFQGYLLLIANPHTCM